MDTKTAQGPGLFFGLVMVVVFVFVGLRMWNNRVDYSKTWWDGAATQKVCKTPYYSTTSCYALSVTAQNGEITYLSFPKGGYFNISNSTCSKAAESYNFDRFCSFNDPADGVRWDVLPPNASY